MMELLLDAAGRRRSPATMPGFHTGRPPRNKGVCYPADPPTVEEIVAVMRTAGDGVHGRRLRGLIVVLWRAGLRISEALSLAEPDLDHRRGSLLVRRGKGGRRREVGMDEWAWEQLGPGSMCGSIFRSVRCSASSTARPADGAGRARRPAPSCAKPPRTLACDDALRRTSSATPRRRDGPRRRPADRHSAPARPQQPWDHLDLAPRHRQCRDHRYRPRPPRTDDPRQHVATASDP
jgi:hypothetical protein